MKEVKGTLEDLTIIPGQRTFRVSLTGGVPYLVDMDGKLTWKHQPVAFTELCGKMDAFPVKVILQIDTMRYGLATEAEFYKPGA